MKKLLTSALIFSAMFATGQRRLVMDETTMEIKNGQITLTTYNQQINDSIRHYLYVMPASKGAYTNNFKPYKFASYFFAKSDTTLLNRFFDRMNKK